MFMRREKFLASFLLLWIPCMRSFTFSFGRLSVSRCFSSLARGRRLFAHSIIGSVSVLRVVVFIFPLSTSRFFKAVSIFFNKISTSSPAPLLSPTDGIPSTILYASFADSRMPLFRASRPRLMSLCFSERSCHFARKSFDLALLIFFALSIVCSLNPPIPGTVCAIAFALLIVAKK